MQRTWSDLQDSLTESRLTLDNLDAVFYFGSMFRRRIPGSPQSTSAHEHAWYEFHCVKKGSLQIKAGEKTYVIKANEALFIPPGAYHITETATEDIRYASLGFELFPNGKSTVENICGYMSGIFTATPCLHLKKCRALTDTLCALLDYTHAGGSPDSVRTHHMLSSFLFLLSDRLGGAVSALPAPAPAAKDASGLRNYLLDYLTSNQIDRMTLGELSEKIFLSKKQINQIVKKRYNMTYKQKQIRFRIENAKKQLADSALPVDQIAMLVGYTNLTSFYQAFRRLTGMTPSEYRKRHAPVHSDKSNAKK